MSVRVRYSYASRTLMVRVSGEEGALFTLAHPLWSSTPAWACQPTGPEPYGTSEAFPTADVARLMDDHIGPLASEVCARALEDRTLAALDALRNTFSKTEGEPAVAAANQVCSSYDGTVDGQA